MTCYIFEYKGENLILLQIIIYLICFHATFDFLLNLLFRDPPPPSVPFRVNSWTAVFTCLNAVVEIFILLKMSQNSVFLLMVGGQIETAEVCI